MIEINLIPSVKKELLRTRSVRNRVISMAFLVGGVSVATIVALAVVFTGQLAAETVQNNSIKEKSQKLTSVDDLDKIITIQHQLTKITTQHDSKKINSRVFDVVSAINPAAPNDVSFSTVKLNPEEKTISLEGSAANGYEALETLKKTILSTKVRTVEQGKTSDIALTDAIDDGTTSFGENSEGKKVLQFSFSFQYPDELLVAAGSSNVTIITPNSKLDVTDSRQSVPDSLFKRKATTNESSSREDK